MFWSPEDRQNFYNNFQIVQHQNGIQQAPPAMPPQQQQHPTPPPQLQQQQQQQPTHRPAQQIPSHFTANQQIPHQHQQWATRPPILTTPPFFQQFPTTVPSSTQYCAAPAQYFHPQRVTQPSAVAAPTQQRPLLPPGVAMYSIPPQPATLRQNVISQPSPTIMTQTTSSAPQIQVQYFQPAQYCQPPMGQPAYGHVITPTVPETPMVKHRKHAIPIIDPDTRENILERDLRKSESTSTTEVLSVTATSSSSSIDLKESGNDANDGDMRQQQQEHPQKHEHQQQEHQQHQEQHGEQQQHPQLHKEIAAAVSEAVPITTEKKEQPDQEKEKENNELVEEAVSEIRKQSDHVESIEAGEEVEEAPLSDEENQSKKNHNDENSQTQTAVSNSTDSPNNAISAVTTPLPTEKEVESSKCNTEIEDADKETPSLTKKNPPADKAVEVKCSTSNQKPSVASTAASPARATQQSATKLNKQQQTQKQQPPPPAATKSSSKKNKKNKRLKEVQKKQQKSELLKIENNNTIKTSQSEVKSKQSSLSSEPSNTTASGILSKPKEIANDSNRPDCGQASERVDDSDLNDESSTKIDEVTETTPTALKEELDQDKQSENISQQMKSKEIASEILGIESNDDNELLFLNSSVSGYEDDICSSPTVPEASASDQTQDLLFGSFSQENSMQEHSMQDENDSLDETDNADDSLTSNPREVKKLSYTLRQLKNLANKPDSKIPPKFKGKISEIIGKIRAGTGSGYMQPTYQQNQMFQQMSYKDSMGYLNRKRNKRPNYVSNYNQYEQQQPESDIIRIYLPLNDEIQLAESENAWVPAGLQISNLKSDAESDEQILKKIRGILNKLTPENFDKLLQSATNFPITGEERMKKVMLLIFEKTVSEPNFAPTYARFCKFLFNPRNQNHSTFKAYLIKRIREEFESNVNNAKAKNAKLKPLMEKLAAATDPKEQLELKAELDDQEYQFRRRAWGTVRFIGEMCKMGFIGTDRVCTCVESLLDPQCEEKLEYMCKLLTTVGAQLEPLDNKQQTSDDRTKIVERLDKIFNSIRRLLAEKKKDKDAGPKISSRVRFMMQDVLDLRMRCWDQKAVPKLYAREVSPAFSARGPPQRSGRTGTGSNYMSPGGYDKRRPTGDGQKNSAPLDVSKLMPLFNKDETTRRLGNSSLLMLKTTGRSQQQQTPLAPPTMQQSNRQQSGSLEPDFKESTAAQQVELTNEECERLLNVLIEVTIEEESQKYCFDKWNEISPAHHSKIIYYLLADYIHSKHVGSQTEINACSRLFTSLMKGNLLTRLSFSEGYRRFGLICDEILVDVPKCWQYVFNLLGPLLQQKLIPFDLVWNKSWYNSPVGEKFLQSMIIHFTSEFGANYMRFFWESNSLRWSVFMSDDRVSNFIGNNRFEFIENHSKAPPVFVQRNTDELVQRIKSLLGQSEQDVDPIIDFINTNVNIDSNFINNLTKFLCDYTVIYCNTPNSSSISSNSSKKCNLSDSLPSALSSSSSSAAAAVATDAPSWKLRDDLFVAKCIPLLRRCIDCKYDHELAALDAIVGRCKQLCESPAEDLISAIFMNLYVEEVISKESFEKWQQQSQLEFLPKATIARQAN